MLQLKAIISFILIPNSIHILEQKRPARTENYWDYYSDLTGHNILTQAEDVRTN